MYSLKTLFQMHTVTVDETTSPAVDLCYLTVYQWRQSRSRTDHLPQSVLLHLLLIPHQEYLFFLSFLSFLSFLFLRSAPSPERDKATFALTSRRISKVETMADPIPPLALITQALINSHSAQNNNTHYS